MIIGTRRQEVFSWYGCPDPTCKIRHWPILPDVGDRCPKCGALGYFKGTVGKLPDPQPGDSDGDGA